MKTLLAFLLLAAFTSIVRADIQDPPINDYGPTRKLSRGLSNLSPASLTELPDTLCTINEREGNAAASTYGVVKGIGRVFYRWGKGVFDVATFPFPTYKGSYRAPYKSNVPWIHGGYQEFSPELGFSTKVHHVRSSYISY